MKRFSSFLSVLIPLALIALLYFANFEFISILELKFTDIIQRSAPQRESTVPIIIVAVDEKSLEEVGRWPWPRDKMAKLIGNISNASPKVIGVDVMFPEKTTSITDTLKKELKSSVRSFFGISSNKIDSFIKFFFKESGGVHPADKALGDAIGRAKNVIMGYHFITVKEDVLIIKGNAKKRKPILPTPFGVVKGETEYLKKITAYGILESIPVISNKAHTGGFFNVVMDADGTVRRVPTTFHFDDNYYPSFSIELVRKYLDLPYAVLVVSEYGIDGVKLGKTFVPTDENGYIWLKYLGPERTIPHISAVDVLKGRTNMTQFKGAVVIVGVSAVGVGDVQVTPMENIYPGVEIHATAVDNIVTENLFFAPGWIKILNISIVLVFGAVFGFLLLRIGPFIGITLTTFIIFGYTLFFRYSIIEKNVVITMIYPAAAFLFLYVSVTTTKYFSETKKKRFIQKAFSHYLSPTVIEQLIKDPDRLNLGGTKKKLTVIFTDLAGFSSISEKSTAEEIVELLNEYFTSMTNIILAHSGTVDKFEGDAIMAFFGAPVETPHHAIQAVRAAHDMSLKLKDLRTKWEGEGKPPLRMRIGINTGSMVVGNMGSVQKMNYTVMGDNVNIAARLEPAGKIYGSEILIGEETKKNVEGEFMVRELDFARVPGREMPVEIYEVVGKKEEIDEATRRKLQLFYDARKLFLNRDFEGAKKIFEKIVKQYPDDKPSRLYVDRCDKLIATPPDDLWEGIFELMIK